MVYAFYHHLWGQIQLIFALRINSRLLAALVSCVQHIFTMTDVQVRAALRTQEEYLRQTKEMMRDIYYLRKAGKTVIG